MDEQGGSNWPKFEDADWPAGGEDKPSGWAFRTKRQDSHPNLKPPYAFVKRRLFNEMSNKKRTVLFVAKLLTMRIDDGL